MQSIDSTTATGRSAATPRVSAPDRASEVRGALPLDAKLDARLDTSLDSSRDELGAAPSRFYVRAGRPLFFGALVLAGLPLAIAVALPIALVNLAIFRSVRRIFFLQPRVGRRGQVFSIWKFRTMREASRDHLDSWRSGEDLLRVTRFGRFLRSSHLDELPQIVNVLRGEMDLVGPRPEMIEVEEWARRHVPGFAARLAIRPGLTGLAQITQGYTGNDVAAYAEKSAINREYLERMSFALDVSIVLRTVAWMLCGRGWADWRIKNPARGARRS